MRLVLENDAIDAKYGFKKIADNTQRTGFLLNMHSVISRIKVSFKLSRAFVE